MESVSSRRLFMVIALVVAVGTSVSPVLAQDAPAEGQEMTRPVAVGEIIVTAQKRAADVQEVPLAVSTLSGEDLELLTVGAPDIRALSGRVPSLVMESSFGRAFPRFYIRGLGNPDFDLNSSQPVSMVVDEVVLENPIVKGMPMFDLDRIEVLRGPQGTLFGRNTPAGIVKFETAKPTREADGYLRASYGSFDTMDVNGAVSGPLTDTLSARFSALYQTRSDWIDNRHDGPESKLGGYDTMAARLQFLYEPNDDFSALFNVHGWDVDGTARVFRANILNQGDGGLVSGFHQDEVWQDGMNSQEITAWGGVLRLEYDLGAATLTSVTGYETLDMYSRGDIDGGFGASFLGEGNYGPGNIPFASESADGLPDLDQLTQELRLSSNIGDQIDWILGAFYFDESLQVDSFGYDSLTPGNPEDGYAFQTQDARAYALFGSMTFHASDVWDFQLGLRFSDEKKDFMAQRVRVPFIQGLLYGVQPSVPIYENVDDNFTSWDLSATYKASDTVNVYGRVATGFRAPSIQGRILWCADVDGTDPETNCVTVADTEKILSFEAGVKSILMDHRLRLNVTGYVFRVDDQQITAVGGVTNTARLLNADKTEGYGLEADVEFTPTANWFGTIGFSYNPTKINDPNLRVAACGGGCTILDPMDDRGVIVDGNPLPHAPDTIFNGILNFRSDPVHKGFFGSLDWAYYSEKSFFLYDSAEFKDDSFELGLRLGYGWNYGKYEVAFFGRNILDEEIVRGGIDFNNLTGFTNDPRIIGIEFVGRF
jgi:iron complex outermembrane recepter protein